jgi:hypothetical protein
MLIQPFGFNATGKPVSRLVSLGQQFDGGTIGYIQGDYPNQTGIIVANEEISGSYAWSSYVGAIPTSAAPFTGTTNTATILSYDPNAYPAKFCSEYTGSGFTDWVLPSLNDLQLINNSVLAVPFMLTLYWSSYTNDLNNAWFFDFNPSSVYVGGVGNGFRCCGPSSPGPGLPFRPVRYFNNTV